MVNDSHMHILQSTHQVHIGGGKKKNTFPKDPTSEFQEEKLRGRSYEMDLDLLRKMYYH